MNSTIPPTNEQFEEQGLPTQNTRGRMQMRNVHSRCKCKLITLNRLNQPVGPTDEVVTELSSFLGTLKRTVTLCPFDILDWRNMDTKKDLWDYTKATPRAFPRSVVFTTSREVAHEGEPFLGQPCELTSSPTTGGTMAHGGHRGL
ncbi:hypothetical protein RDI58_022137 [Solanum bulbocastanum]|uniref:Uncharacterized protein n=1 Tax=Solanum bulbocastanum TaxID=147425 RepID=A0AAN8Y7T4_SOLBU